MSKIKSTALLFLAWALCLQALPIQTIYAVNNGNQNPMLSMTQTSKISPDLQKGVGDSHTANKVILHLSSKPSGQLNALLNRNGVHIKAHFEQFNFYSVELPPSVINELADFDEVAFISPDRKLKSLGHLSATTGADSIRTVSGTNTTGLDGTGIGIAILDSGIDATHTAFLDRSNTVRIAYSQDFTGEGRTDDPFGHGTHVAAIAAGNGRISNAAYLGIAPNARLINLRVLNSKGEGTTSQVLSALNWLLANRLTYNIRVVNMSLGMPAIDSYKNDPICKAVRQLVDAGVVVTTAAGNNGKDSTGKKIYGQIHSPGDEPSAITVGAANTFGTDFRGDDVVTTYSSRGPTRGYWTDTLGTKHHDNLIKPDLIAPGNKIIEAEAANNSIVTQNPQLDAGVSPVLVRKQMYLNGTSMAAPVAAGAAALMLQANPNLTPNMVKMFLMYTAQRLIGYNTLEQGAGELNIEGAVRLAKLVRTDLTNATPVGAPLLTTLTPPTPQTTIAGYTFTWSQGAVLNQNYAQGSALITYYQKIYGTGVLLGDGVVISNGVIIGDQTMLSSGVVIGDGVLVSNGVLMSDGTLFCSSGVLLGDGVLMSDGVLLGDGVLMGDSTVLASGVLMGDYTMQAQAAVTGGDSTTGMIVLPDTGVDFLGY